MIYRVLLEYFFQWWVILNSVHSFAVAWQYIAWPFFGLFFFLILEKSRWILDGKTTGSFLVTRQVTMAKTVLLTLNERSPVVKAVS